MQCLSPLPETSKCNLESCVLARAWSQQDDRLGAFTLCRAYPPVYFVTLKGWRDVERNNGIHLTAIDCCNDLWVEQPRRCHAGWPQYIFVCILKVPPTLQPSQRLHNLRHHRRLHLWPGCLFRQGRSQFPDISVSRSSTYRAKLVTMVYLCSLNCIISYNCSHLTVYQFYTLGWIGLLHKGSGFFFACNLFRSSWDGCCTERVKWPSVLAEAYSGSCTSRLKRFLASENSYAQYLSCCFCRALPHDSNAESPHGLPSAIENDWFTFQEDEIHLLCQSSSTRTSFDLGDSSFTPDRSYWYPIIHFLNKLEMDSNAWHPRGVPLGRHDPFMLCVLLVDSGPYGVTRWLPCRRTSSPVWPRWHSCKCR